MQQCGVLLIALKGQALHAPHPERCSITSTTGPCSQSAEALKVPACKHQARRSDGGVSARSGRQVCVRAVRVAYITSSPQETGWAVGKNTQA
eukprot:scaffold96350_cov21-Tisochrysis_lutea.AAC.1